MNTLAAYFMSLAHQADKVKTFDWDKAARLIKETTPRHAGAYLEDDYEYTYGDIFKNGNPINEGAYLSSKWATPMLILDGEHLPCWAYKDDLPENKTGHEWTESALEILRGNN